MLWEPAPMPKVVKLNGRHKLYKDIRMTYAWRFEEYSKYAKQITELERFLRDRYGDQEWGWKYSQFRQGKQWATHWSDARRNRPRVYWVAVKDPEVIMVAKLAGIDF
jgi:hypothetical protein